MYIRNVLRKKKINVAAGASVAAEDFQKTENEGDENNIEKENQDVEIDDEENLDRENDTEAQQDTTANLPKINDFILCAVKVLTLTADLKK
jgi:hypothetical protein